MQNFSPGLRKSQQAIAEAPSPFLGVKQIIHDNTVSLGFKQLVKARAVYLSIKIKNAT